MSLTRDEVMDGVGRLRVLYEGIAGIVSGYDWTDDLVTVTLIAPVNRSLTAPRSDFEVAS